MRPGFLALARGGGARGAGLLPRDNVIPGAREGVRQRMCYEHPPPPSRQAVDADVPGGQQPHRSGQLRLRLPVKKEFTVLGRQRQAPQEAFGEANADAGW